MRLPHLLIAICLVKTSVAMGSMSLEDKAEALKVMGSRGVTWDELKSRPLARFLQNQAKGTVEKWERKIEMASP